MKSNRRQFLSTCAAAGVVGRASVATAEAQNALDTRGIAVRAGDMAARPLLKRFGAAEAVRASAYVYSTRGDIDRLADALREIGK